MVKIRLSRLLGGKRQSQAKLARITGIRAPTINDIYNELLERISLKHFNRICRALDCDILDMLEYIPDGPR